MIEEADTKPQEQDNEIEVHTIESDLKMLSDEEESMQESMTTETTKLDEAEKVEDESKEEAQEEPKEEAPKKKSRAQRRIERLARENKDLREQLDAKPNEEEAKEIDIDDYEDFESYEKALADAEEEKTKDDVDVVFQDKVSELFEDGEEDYENFAELVQAEDLAISQEMLEFTINSEKAADIAYFLATHKDKAREIAGLRHRDMEKELLRIEISLEDDKTTTKQVRTSKAPKPITPVTGSSATSKSLNDENLSFEEHAKLLAEARGVVNPGGFI